MTTRAHEYSRPEHIRQVNRQDLEATIVQGTIAVLGVACLVLWWYLLPRDEPDAIVFGWIPASIAGLAACYRVSRVSPAVAGTLLVASTFAAAAMLIGTSLPQAGLLFVVPLVLAAALFHPAGSLMVAALSLPLLTGIAWAEPEPVAAALIAIVAACTWVATRPQYSLLQWSWRRSAEATQLAEMLRDRQAELNRSISALDLTNRLLQRTNHELALARYEADEARRVKEEFAAGISHELRTPLNIILGFAEIMHESPEVYGEAKWPATLRRDVTEVYRSARYLSDMIDDVLDLARVEAALMPVHREPTDLCVVLTEAMEISRGLVRDRSVTLETHIAPDLPVLLIDRARIRQVMLNLLANASRYTETGSIRVSARLEVGQVVVAVADTGVGIPEEQLETIFSEYRQVDPARDAENQGKGLGLAIAKRFVQLHGGSIWVESTVGQGSTFYFALPVDRKDF
ncbi:MAG: sensor histidine kinase, partial [Anaerolineae bacterium]